MPDFLNYLDKTCNLEFCRPAIFLDSGEKSRKNKKRLDRAANRPTVLKQILINGYIKDNCSKSKLLEGVQINPQGFVGVMMYESKGVAQGLLNTLE